MKQADFNKLNGTQIHELLKRHPNTVDAQEAAVALLGYDARDWWANRTETALGRIVDPQTGKWKTPFTANGHKYHIISPAEGIGIERYSMLSQMLSVVGFNASYAEQMTLINKMIGAANSLVTKEPKLDTLFEALSNMQKAITAADRDYHSSFYAATLVILREGEKTTDAWSEALANEKIEDWRAEGLHEHDFFLLVMLRASQSAEWWKGLSRQLRAQHPSLFPQAS